MVAELVPLSHLVHLAGCYNRAMVEFTRQHMAFLAEQRAGRLATADRAGQPHVVPVCYVCDGRSIYIALDEKPKRVPVERLKRVRNLLENGQVALVVDRYDDDWSRLAYILVHGRAELIAPGTVEHNAALPLLRARYPQYRQMALEAQPMIAIRPVSITSWGAIDPGSPGA